MMRRSDAQLLRAMVQVLVVPYIVMYIMSEKFALILYVNFCYAHLNIFNEICALLCDVSFITEKVLLLLWVVQLCDVSTSFLRGSNIQSIGGYWENNYY